MKAATTSRRLTAIARWLPVLSWGSTYDRGQWSAGMLAASIATLMLIPQSLAYAMLAGLPPQAGLYAGMLALLAYAMFGRSRTLAVGPAAVSSLMTAAAVGQVASVGSTDYWAAALVLALLSGLMLALMGVLRPGWSANYRGHPVMDRAAADDFQVRQPPIVLLIWRELFVNPARTELVEALRQTQDERYRISGINRAGSIVSNIFTASCLQASSGSGVATSALGVLAH
jgi:hypothetical protein